MSTTSTDQAHYIDEPLERFDPSGCNPAQVPMITWLSVHSGGGKLSVKDHETYRSMVGSDLYLACWTRLLDSTSLSLYQSFLALSRLPGRCICRRQSLTEMSSRHSRGGSRHITKPADSGPMSRPNILWGYVDSDSAGCADSRSSTSGRVLTLSGAAASRNSKRQPAAAAALSSAEAEFIAAPALVQEVMHARRRLEAPGVPHSDPACIYGDNPACTAWSEGSVGGTDRAKRVDLREHCVHDAVEAKTLRLMPIDTMDNAADLLTKPPPRAAFLTPRKRLTGLQLGFSDPGVPGLRRCLWLVLGCVL